MSRLSQLLHLDDGEFPALRAQIEAQSMPRVGVPATTRRPLRIDEQARSVAALAGLRTETPVLGLRVVNGIGMRRPAAPSPVDAPKLPSRNLIEYVTAVSTAIHADYERHLDTLRTIDEISAAAPDTHTLRMALTPILAQLALYDTKAEAGL